MGTVTGSAGGPRCGILLDKGTRGARGERALRSARSGAEGRVFREISNYGACDFHTPERVEKSPLGLFRRTNPLAWLFAKPYAFYRR